jgi:hypothetical protein
LGKAEAENDVPTAAAISKLQEDPSLAKEFDAKYGPGSSRRYLKES